jgi:hypothetical protein
MVTRGQYLHFERDGALSTNRRTCNPCFRQGISHAQLLTAFAESHRLLCTTECGFAIATYRYRGQVLQSCTRLIAGENALLKDLTPIDCDPAPHGWLLCTVDGPHTFAACARLPTSSLPRSICTCEIVPVNSNGNSYVKSIGEPTSMPMSMPSPSEN